MEKQILNVKNEINGNKVSERKINKKIKIEISEKQGLIEGKLLWCKNEVSMIINSKRQRKNEE